MRNCHAENLSHLNTSLYFVRNSLLVFDVSMIASKIRDG